eukprot:scaffold169578_cov36-Attheya_sp.AAC.1
MEITRVPHTVPATACLHSITTHNRDIRGISYEIRGAFCKNSKVRGAILARIPNSGEHTHSR